MTEFEDALDNVKSTTSDNTINTLEENTAMDKTQWQHVHTSCKFKFQL